MRRLILTGFMGTGKTTVGRILGGRYGLLFVDSDDEIERRAGCTIAEFFARHSEPAFRDLEQEVFAEIMSRPGRRIVATGGGTLLPEGNRALLHPDDAVVTLTGAPETLSARLWRESTSRPLLAGLDEVEIAGAIAGRLERRRPVYDLFAQVDTTKKCAEDVACEVAEHVDLESDVLRFDGTRQTTVIFRRGFASELGPLFSRHGLNGRALGVTDDCVVSLPGPKLALQSLAACGGAAAPAVLPAGERHKTWESVHAIYRACRAAGLDRSSTLVGVGGGVIGDVAGFAAATYMRGIRLVLVPTTLLAQVDAALGGKVGIDLDGVKNLVGAFHPAALVVIDPDLLETLPDAALSDGLAEIVKIAAVFDADLLARVESLHEPRDILDAPDIIRSAAELKARVVESDPYERGARALLNFGHTIGHALEAASGYSMSHGQAVAAGMAAETWLAQQLGVVEAGMLERLTAILDRLRLPRHAPGIDAGMAAGWMESDKKRLAGALRFALPAAPGRGVVVEVSAADARTALSYATRGQP